MIVGILTVIFKLPLAVDVFDTIVEEAPIADTIDIAAIITIQVSILMV